MSKGKFARETTEIGYILIQLFTILSQYALVAELFRPWCTEQC